MRLIASEKPESLRLICLSCSLADYREVAEWMGASPENTFNFHPSVRPNSVEVVFNSYEQPIRESRLHMMQKNLMQNVLHYNRSTLVVVSDKKQARITALDLVSELAGEAAPKRLKKINERQMDAFAKRISDQYLLHIIDYGIGYIYEGMNEFEREIVEELFKVEGITVLVITQALKWEIDYKVFMVAVLDCCKYDARAARWNDYSIPDMAQLMGLAAISEKDKHKGK
jgi:replicative superfamily II helicase